MGKKSGYEIAMSVDPNISNDVCTFCRHSEWRNQMLDSPRCRLGHTPYFRSLSNMGPIWVSDCAAGELRDDLKSREIRQ